MDLQNLTPEEKVQKAKIKVQMDSPFFGHLVLHLNYVETDRVPTLAVDPNGNMYYNPEYVEQRSLDEMKGLVVHEILHCGLQHFERRGSRDSKMSNYAQDIVINDMLNSNGFELPDDGLVPNDDHSITIGKGSNKFTIENVDEKNFEEVYEEVEQGTQDMDNPPNMPSGKSGQGQGQGGGGGGNSPPSQSDDNDLDTGSGSGGDDYADDLEDQSNQQNVGGGNPSDLPDRTDVHMEDTPDGDPEEVDQPDAKTQIDESTVSDDKDFEKIMDKAKQTAKQQGNMPSGVGRRIEEMKQADVNWRTVLQNYITNMLPFDYEMQRPNKKYRHLGIHLPSTKQEELDIVVAMDTSGSISTDELQQFAGEVVGICQGFDNVNLTVVQHTARVTQVDEITSTREAKNLEMAESGGTDHRPVYKWIEENKRDAELVINFTDGYTSFPREHEVMRNLDTIWVLDNYQIDEDNFDYGKIIRNVPEEVA